jgi:membrane protease YdiL (CAAX protease family)
MNKKKSLWKKFDNITFTLSLGIVVFVFLIKVGYDLWHEKRIIDDRYLTSIGFAFALLPIARVFEKWSKNLENRFLYISIYIVVIIIGLTPAAVLYYFAPKNDLNSTQIWIENSIMLLPVLITLYALFSYYSKRRKESNRKNSLEI